MSDQRDLIRNARGQAREALDAGLFEGDNKRAQTTVASGSSAIGFGVVSVPGYSIRREIHRGGQGVVYEAVQESTKQSVAIKVLKEGPFAGATGLSRFQREIAVLGQLRHPNIVTIHDSGSASGNVYLVMDYIAGKQLDEFVTSRSFTVRELLHLFVRICDAVNAAHLRGVIHRDLKPGNIRIDEDGNPHVLDFGLAKIESEDPEATVMTQTGQFLGSIPWSAPEQAEGRPEQVDVRTDVYALGVVLFQILTGRFPYDVVGPIREVLDRIIKSEPCRPSDLRSDIDDEVNTIILKSLSKEPQRRYQTAGALAADVRRYLSGEAIEAKSDSGWYVLRKSLRRHWVPVTTVAAFFLLLIAAVITSTGYYLSAESQRKIALTKEQAAIESSKLATQRTEEAQRLVSFQRDLIEGLDPLTMGQQILVNLRQQIKEQMTQAGQPGERIEDSIAQLDGPLGWINSVDLAKSVLETQLLSRADETIESKFASQPRIAADLRESIAVIFEQLGFVEKATDIRRRVLSQRQESLGADHVDTYSSMANLARSMADQGQFDEADELYRSAIAGLREVAGEHNEFTLTAMHGRAEMLRRAGDIAEAESLFREVIAGRKRVLGEQHPHTLSSIEALGVLLASKNQFAEAEKLLQEAIDGYRHVHGDADHQQTLGALNNMASLLDATGRSKEALDTWKQVLAGFRRLLGNSHPSTLTAMNNVAAMLYERGEFEEATPLFAQALESRRRLYGDKHPSVIESMSGMASILMQQGKLEDAEHLLTTALSTARDTLGSDHPLTLIMLNNNGYVRYLRGHYSEAREYFAQALQQSIAIHGEIHNETLARRQNLGMVLQKEGDLESARTQYEKAVAGKKELLGEGHESTLMSMLSLGKLLQTLGRIEQAESTLRAAHDGLLITLGEQHANTLSAKHALGQVLGQIGEQNEAVSLLREALQGRQAVLGGDHPQTIETAVQLAKCLIKGARFSEAEPLLLSAAKQCQDHPEALGDQESVTREAIVALYESWNAVEPDAGYDRMAEKWRHESRPAVGNVEPD